MRSDNVKSNRILTIFCLVAACVFVLLKIDFIADKPTSFPDANFNNDMYHGYMLQNRQ